MSDGVLGKSEPRRNIRDHLVPTPREGALRRRQVRELDDNQRGQKYDNQGPQREGENPDGHAGEWRGAMKGEEVRDDDRWKGEGEGELDRAHPFPRSRLTRFA
jgi:hypothetical protein